MCLTSFFPRPSLTLGYFILAPHPSHMLQLEEQRQSLWNNLYCGGKAGPRQLAWLRYLLPARAQGTDVMAQCLPAPRPQRVSICVQGRDMLCSGLPELLSGALGTPSPLTYLRPLALTHLPLCLAPLHLTSVTSQTWERFNQRCWGGGFPGGPGGKVPTCQCRRCWGTFRFLPASLQTLPELRAPSIQPLPTLAGAWGRGCLLGWPPREHLEAGIGGITALFLALTQFSSCWWLHRAGKIPLVLFALLSLKNQTAGKLKEHHTPRIWKAELGLGQAWSQQKAPRVWGKYEMQTAKD